MFPFRRKLRALELRDSEAAAGGADAGRAELRARLAEAERLVRRLRADADRQRREVLGGAGAGVTNLLFDGAAATHAHVRHSRTPPTHYIHTYTHHTTRQVHCSIGTLNKETKYMN